MHCAPNINKDRHNQQPTKHADMFLFLQDICLRQIMIITTPRLTAFYLGLPGWAGTRKVKPNWILLKQDTVSGSGIIWAICKSAPHPRQITTPAPTTQFFAGRIPLLPPNQQHQNTEGNKLW